MFDSSDVQIEQHLRVKDVAARLSVSRQTVERMFADHPDVKHVGTTRSTRAKRRYSMMLIPTSALDEYLARN